jgi:hypothetical protein
MVGVAPLCRTNCEGRTCFPGGRNFVQQLECSFVLATLWQVVATCVVHWTRSGVQECSWSIGHQLALYQGRNADEWMQARFDPACPSASLSSKEPRITGPY